MEPITAGVDVLKEGHKEKSGNEIVPALGGREKEEKTERVNWNLKLGVRLDLE